MHQLQYLFGPIFPFFCDGYQRFFIESVLSIDFCQHVEKGHSPLLVKSHNLRENSTGGDAIFVSCKITNQKSITLFAPCNKLHFPFLFQYDRGDEFKAGKGGKMRDVKTLGYFSDKISSYNGADGKLTSGKPALFLPPVEQVIDNNGA